MAVSINVQAEVLRALRGGGKRTSFGEQSSVGFLFCGESPVFRGLGESRVLCESSGWLCVTMYWKREPATVARKCPE